MKLFRSRLIVSHKKGSENCEIFIRKFFIGIIVVVDVRRVRVVVFTERVLLINNHYLQQSTCLSRNGTHKSLSELCMDSIVDNMERWTALRSSVHVFCHFYLLRECLWNTWLLVGYCYNYFITAF
jgi:hypothetical protein